MGSIQLVFENILSKYKNTCASVSHDPSEIILIHCFAQETSLIIKVENSCAGTMFYRLEILKEQLEFIGK